MCEPKSFVKVFYDLVHRHLKGQQHIFNWNTYIRPCSLNINLLAMKFVSYVTFVFIDSQLTANLSHLQLTPLAFHFVSVVLRVKRNPTVEDIP